MAHNVLLTNKKNIMEVIMVDNVLVDNYDKINSLDLRGDLENGNITDCVLKPEGYVGNRPTEFDGDLHEDDTWAIDCLLEDGTVINSYLYVSEFEYNQDVEILNNFN
jgi:hypothetical protein